MYNGKFEREKPELKETVVRYLPIAFIVLISATIVLLGYWLCLALINAVKVTYEFFVENIDKFTLSSDAFVVIGVIALLVVFAIVVKKSYFGEWATYYPDYVEEEKSSNITKKTKNVQKNSEPKMVRKTENTVSKQQGTKQKRRQVKSNTAEYDVSLNEVVWTNEEPSKRYGYKF